MNYNVQVRRGQLITVVCCSPPHRFCLPPAQVSWHYESVKTYPNLEHFPCRQRSAGRLRRYRLRRRSRMRPRRQRSLAARREERGGANCRVSAPVPELRALSLHQRGRHRWPSGARLLVVCRLCRADRRGGFERRRCRLARLRSSGQGGVGGPAPRAHGRRRCHDAGTDAGGRLVDRAWCGPGAPRVCPRDLKRRHRHREVGQAARVRLGSRQVPVQARPAVVPLYAD